MTYETDQLCCCIRRNCSCNLVYCLQARDTVRRSEFWETERILLQFARSSHRRSIIREQLSRRFVVIEKKSLPNGRQRVRAFVCVGGRTAACVHRARAWSKSRRLSQFVPINNRGRSRLILLSLSFSKKKKKIIARVERLVTKRKLCSVNTVWVRKKSGARNRPRRRSRASLPSFGALQNGTR